MSIFLTGVPLSDINFRCTQYTDLPDLWLLLLRYLSIINIWRPWDICPFYKFFWQNTWLKFAFRESFSLKYELPKYDIFIKTSPQLKIGRSETD